MTDYKLLVLSRPVPGGGGDFDKWYDTHVHELVRSARHVVGAQRFRAVSGTPCGDSPYPHLVIAEWRAEDLAESWAAHGAEFAAGMADGTFTALSDSFDTSDAPHWFYTAITPRLTSG